MTPSSPIDWLLITSDPLRLTDAVDFVTTPAAGGINIFLGVTRAELNAQSHPLLSLDYEAYVEMAQEQLAGLARRAREKWPILKLAILHRISRVNVGEPSVLIAVSTPHRAESFEACRWIIDTLKKEVAIWKKEVWSDGTATWVNAT